MIHHSGLTTLTHCGGRVSNVDPPLLDDVLASSLQWSSSAVLSLWIFSSSFFPFFHSGRWSKKNTGGKSVSDGLFCWPSLTPSLDNCFSWPHRWASPLWRDLGKDLNSQSYQTNACAVQIVIQGCILSWLWHFTHFPCFPLFSLTPNCLRH